MLKKLPIDAETHKLLKYDPLYYVPNTPYNDHEFSKLISKLQIAIQRCKLNLENNKNEKKEEKL